MVMTRRKGAATCMPAMHRHVTPTPKNGVQPWRNIAATVREALISHTDIAPLILVNEYTRFQQMLVK